MNAHKRCTIVYRWSPTSQSGGTENFGVTDENDPRIEERKKSLTDRGMHIKSVTFDWSA